MNTKSAFNLYEVPPVERFHSAPKQTGLIWPTGKSLPVKVIMIPWWRPHTTSAN